MFMGKGTFDYKNIEGFNDNFVPTWQTEESLILIFGADSYCTDDFFARVDGEDLIPDLCTAVNTVGNTIPFVQLIHDVYPFPEFYPCA